MINFYPGPSRIYDSVPKILEKGFQAGILSMNHRSEEFMEMVRKTKKVLRRNLSIPEDYEIIFTSSATECWEIFGQSAVSGRVQSIYNGAFGEKWYNYLLKLNLKCSAVSFDIQQKLPIEKIDEKAEWLCLTLNETSNGTFLSNSLIKSIHQKIPDLLIAVDVTSAMGGLNIDFSAGDYWFASVQKCFGLPPGLGVLVVSPRAIEKVNTINESNHYNSLTSIIANSRKNQTHYTPNIPAIWSLYRTQKKLKPVDEIDAELRRRASTWEDIIANSTFVHWLIEDPELRSPTVLGLAADQPDHILNEAKRKGVILGKGYGKWKMNTVRVANFPAIKRKEIKYLKQVLSGIEY